MSSNKKFCVMCGLQCDINDKFCTVCGYKFAEPVTTAVAPAPAVEPEPQVVAQPVMDVPVQAPVAPQAVASVQVPVTPEPQAAPPVQVPVAPAPAVEPEPQVVAQPIMDAPVQAPVAPQVVSPVQAPVAPTPQVVVPPVAVQYAPVAEQPKAPRNSKAAIILKNTMALALSILMIIMLFMPLVNFKVDLKKATNGALQPAYDSDGDKYSYVCDGHINYSISPLRAVEYAGYIVAGTFATPAQKEIAIEKAELKMEPKMRAVYDQIAVSARSGVFKPTAKIRRQINDYASFVAKYECYYAVEKGNTLVFSTSTVALLVIIYAVLAIIFFIFSLLNFINFFRGKRGHGSKVITLMAILTSLLTLLMVSINIVGADTDIVVGTTKGVSKSFFWPIMIIALGLVNCVVFALTGKDRAKMPIARKVLTFVSCGLAIAVMFMTLVPLNTFKVTTKLSDTSYTDTYKFKLGTEYYRNLSVITQEEIKQYEAYNREEAEEMLNTERFEWYSLESYQNGSMKITARGRAERLFISNGAGKIAKYIGLQPLVSIVAAMGGALVLCLSMISLMKVKKFDISTKLLRLLSAVFMAINIAVAVCASIVVKYSITDLGFAAVYDMGVTAGCILVAIFALAVIFVPIKLKKRVKMPVDEFAVSVIDDADRFVDTL